MATRLDAPAFDSAHFRRVLGHFPTGVVAVSAMDGDEPVGLTVGSFASVSLDPPMIGFFPSVTSTSWPRIERAGTFVANVLAEHQAELSSVFATSGGDKFGRLPWQRSATGAPILDDVAAWIECEVADVVPAGDHLFVLGRVLDLAVAGDPRPLVFFQGDYARLAGR
ncbi:MULTISPECIES: flavin reductase family protein [unclassified Streptomyces]|uniref:flavin reductase family protein n=1 Tax=unclassified Streptomyces TaxID=2593676 RepID=UPI0016602E30|nr:MULTISPECIES: flavin reductase family protein [unclassified Streptomyces]MBD0711705.1 monooxygenase [Streptomyces sp. CBMA291]MBD0713884.1 monooxygenase [Streptomyces sp. CBMA370]